MLNVGYIEHMDHIYYNIKHVERWLYQMVQV